MHASLIKALQRKEIFTHPIDKFEIMETHLSWIILTGQFAYKIKKPLNLGIQDFTTLEKRKFYCELELKLNQQIAPELYVGLITIYGSPENPTFEPTGEVIEYAIKMHEFSQSCLLVNLAIENKITKNIIFDLAKKTADYHQHTEVCLPSSPYGSPQQIFSIVNDNFVIIKQLTTDNHNQINQIQAWAHEQYHQLESWMVKRKEAGKIRACHGDLHLRNVVMIQNKPVIFDCIEFNENIRRTDVIGDISFLAMDLDRFHLSGLSNYYINVYLEHTGDYEGCLFLKYYQCYRAMVRAKVYAWQANQEYQATHVEMMRLFLNVAEKYTVKRSPQLMLTFGVSGSGKSYTTEDLCMKLDAIRLRTDIIRKHLLGIDPFSPSSNAIKPKLYSSEMTKKVFERLYYLTSLLLDNYQTVIIDGTFLLQSQRQIFIDLALQRQLPFQILGFDVDPALLEKRIVERLQQGGDPSDADLQVLKNQLNSLEPLTEFEKQFLNSQIK